jgi:hypothetical protein
MSQVSMLKLHTALAIAASMAFSAASEAQDTGVAGAMRSAVASQLRSELILWALVEGAVPPADSGLIQLYPVPVLPGLSVWRAEVPNVSHWHPYLLANIDSRVFRLGGFTTPDLVAYVAAALSKEFSPDSAVSRATLFARLLDPHGSTRVIPLASAAADTDAKRALETLNANRQGDWPRDTVLRFGANTLVRLTVFSLNAGTGYGNHWVPIGYAFDFANDGRLQGWSRRLRTAATTP